MEKPKVTAYEKNLRQIFWADDQEFVARAARLFVLYEDLRIEDLGSRFTKPIEPIDDLGKTYR